MGAKARGRRTRDSDATDGRGVRLVLAQDGPQAGQDIAEWLTSAGYDVRLSRDGKSTADMVHIVEPSLLVLDLVTPSADQTESELWVHIASVSLSHGIADSAWLIAV